MRVAALLGGLVIGSLVAGACGGGGGDESTDTITDPARVPTSTPIGEALKYEIRGGVVSVPLGTTAPPPDGSTPTPVPPTTYVIQSGDNCDSIAQSHGIDRQALIDANDSINEDCTNLVAGESLVVPGSTPAPGSTPEPAATPTVAPSDSGQTYTVQAGDTCYDIALSYNVSLEDLRALNGFDEACSLNVGEVVKIP